MKYEEPTLTELGSIFELTNGQNGSSLDGNNTMQTGGGNDTDDPTDDTP